MRGRQLSYRNRRRLIVLSAFAAVAAGIAVAIVLLPRGERIDRKATSVTPATPDAPEPSRPKPRSTHLTADDKARLKSAIALFISTSVARHHPERSWPIVDTTLREGLTRKQWSSGNIPVVPFPAAGVDLIRLEQIADRKALVEVMLAPTRQSHLPHKTFQVELHLQPRGPQRWTISAWVPEGVSTRTDTSSPEMVAAAAHPHRFSAVWIVVGLCLFVGALILLPVGVFARDHYRFRRARTQFEGRRGDAGRLGR